MCAWWDLTAGDAGAAARAQITRALAQGWEPMLAAHTNWWHVSVALARSCMCVQP